MAAEPSGRGALRALVAVAVAHQLRHPTLARLLDFEEAHLPPTPEAGRGAARLRADLVRVLARPDLPLRAPGEVIFARPTPSPSSKAWWTPPASGVNSTPHPYGPASSAPSSATWGPVEPALSASVATSANDGLVAAKLRGGAPLRGFRKSPYRKLPHRRCQRTYFAPGGTSASRGQDGQLLLGAKLSALTGTSALFGRVHGEAHFYPLTR